MFFKIFCKNDFWKLYFRKSNHQKLIHVSWDKIDSFFAIAISPKSDIGFYRSRFLVGDLYERLSSEALGGLPTNSVELSGAQRSLARLGEARWSLAELGKNGWAHRSTAELSGARWSLMELGGAWRSSTLLTHLYWHPFIPTHIRYKCLKMNGLSCR